MNNCSFYIIFSFNSIFLFKPCILYFIQFFLTREILIIFPFTENTFLVCEQYVCAGTNTLMSISDGLGPSIFCRKLERARPMREEMDGRVVYFPPESEF